MEDQLNFTCAQCRAKARAVRMQEEVVLQAENVQRLTNYLVWHLTRVFGVDVDTAQSMISMYVLTT